MTKGDDMKTDATYQILVKASSFKLRAIAADMLALPDGHSRDHILTTITGILMARAS